MDFQITFQFGELLKMSCSGPWEAIVPISSEFYFFWCHTGSLKLAVASVYAIETGKLYTQQVCYSSQDTRLFNISQHVAADS